MTTGLRQSALWLAATATVLAAAGCGQLASPTGAARDGHVAARAVKNELIVRFKSVQGRQALMQKLGLRTVKQVARLEAVVVKAPDPAAALKALKADPAVAYAEPNQVIKLIEPKEKGETPELEAPASNDPKSRWQWALGKIQAREAWAVSRGRSAVKLAIVDTGIDYDHPDLAGRVDKGRDFINNDDDAKDDQGHGTHCAGIAAASTGNGVGIAGLAPDVSLIAVKVLSREGYGSNESVANGIVYAADRGADVISLSLGGSDDSQVITDAVAYARGKGALVVAAMGNESTTRPSYPAATAGVMAVGSTTFFDWKSTFSNMGPHISVSAPGSMIVSTVPGGGYQSMSGTSMACPYVAGLAALVKSKHADFTADQVRAKIEATADDVGAKGFDAKFGHGRINARRALTE